MIILLIYSILHKHILLIQYTQQGMTRQYDFPTAVTNITVFFPNRITKYSAIAFQYNYILFKKRDMKEQLIYSNPDRLRICSSGEACIRLRSSRVSALFSLRSHQFLFLHPLLLLKEGQGGYFLFFLFLFFLQQQILLQNPEVALHSQRFE